MALAHIWKGSPNQLDDKMVHQVLGFAGDGKLKDGGATSKEFREFSAQNQLGTANIFSAHRLQEMLMKMTRGFGMKLAGASASAGKLRRDKRLATLESEGLNGNENPGLPSVAPG